MEKPRYISIYDNHIDDLLSKVNQECQNDYKLFQIVNIHKENYFYGYEAILELKDEETDFRYKSKFKFE